MRLDAIQHLHQEHGAHKPCRDAERQARQNREGEGAHCRARRRHRRGATRCAGSSEAEVQAFCSCAGQGAGYGQRPQHACCKDMRDVEAEDAEAAAQRRPGQQVNRAQGRGAGDDRERQQGKRAGEQRATALPSHGGRGAELLGHSLQALPQSLPCLAQGALHGRGRGGLRVGTARALQGQSLRAAPPVHRAPKDLPGPSHGHEVHEHQAEHRGRAQPEPHLPLCGKDGDEAAKCRANESTQRISINQESESNNHGTFSSVLSLGMCNNRLSSQHWVAKDAAQMPG
mmetsp:Transcript_20191/g.63242  ORF Transcript_20191/g.63242 Transcript_20191/m.63242 type:complete len:286 (+) Transcript_20191:484-1341(+)